MVVIGASAGGVEPLMRLVGGLSADLPAAVFVVLHMAPNWPSALPAILDRAGPLPAERAVDGESVEYGRIYVASPNQHLYVHRGHVRVAVGPRENGSRPAVDVLFRSASSSYGPRVIGVVLSGTLSDGSLGLAAVKLGGGTAIVQDPAEALFGGMPSSALEATDVDYCVPVADIAPIVERLARTSTEPRVSEGMNDNEHDTETTDRLEERVEIGATEEKEPGNASGLTCPECHGSIWELRDGQSVRFECRVGHAYGADAFVEHQGERVEAALWTAVNTLEERASTCRRLAVLHKSSSSLARNYEDRAAHTLQQAQVLR
ncbi:MAG: chemotaxis protein CheB, partial [Chloroflexi bacterium]|nr:chemotaxis protein CheB [Chloroflexota bacterium]